MLEAYRHYNTHLSGNELWDTDPDGYLERYGYTRMERAERMDAARNPFFRLDPYVGAPDMDLDVVYVRSQTDPTRSTWYEVVGASGTDHGSCSCEDSWYHTEYVCKHRLYVRDLFYQGRLLPRTLRPSVYDRYVVWIPHGP